ncbi:tautomerase family protein [Gordonia terrae]|uniref:tautomerase family protein n=1 Tax=Gordonia hongkongensis TaxID=1701090 RepID=UPI0022B58414|nr:tautomerase family protein [Gordonia terrae]
MPVAHFHVPAGSFTDEQQRTLLLEASSIYSQVLDSPIERVRTFLVSYPPTSVAVAGAIVAEGGTVAPYFTAIVLHGRPASQRHLLLERFTDLIVDVFEVDRSGIRGQIIEVNPENWGIAGSPASELRAGEAAARAAGRSR